MATAVCGCMAMSITLPGAGEPRLTFTLPVLKSAGRLALHIEGAEKKQVLKQALAFPMYAASAWLVWVLAQQAGPHGVLLALSLSIQAQPTAHYVPGVEGIKGAVAGADQPVGIEPDGLLRTATDRAHVWNHWFNAGLVRCGHRVP